jgi:hypothetical protein
MLFAKEQWNKMQITQGRETAKTAYFRRIADGLRRQLNDVETQLNKALRDRHNMLPAKDFQTEQRIVWLDKRRQDLKARVSRAMFNVGRI